MKRTYVGPHDEVEVALPLGGKVKVKHGETAKLPDSLCVLLDEQPSNWRKPDKEK